jgi:hypothetical protein
MADTSEMLARTPIKHIQKAWERIAPLQLADKSWDNVSGSAMFSADDVQVGTMIGR